MSVLIICYDCLWKLLEPFDICYNIMTVDLMRLCVRVVCCQTTESYYMDGGRQCRLCPPGEKEMPSIIGPYFLFDLLFPFSSLISTFYPFILQSTIFYINSEADRFRMCVSAHRFLGIMRKLWESFSLSHDEKWSSVLWPHPSLVCRLGQQALALCAPSLPVILCSLLLCSSLLSQQQTVY